MKIMHNKNNKFKNSIINTHCSIIYIFDSLFNNNKENILKKKKKAIENDRKMK